MGRPRTWTDDDLRDAVAASTTVADVVRRLRLSRGGAAYVTVRTRMEQLGLTVGAVRDDGTSTLPDRSWSEDDVRQAVARVTSLNGVFEALGLVVGGSQWLVMRSLILDRGWSTEHWDRPLEVARDRPGEVSPADMRAVIGAVDLGEVVRTSRTRADVIRYLGFTPTTTTYRILAEAMEAAALSDDHFEAPHAAMRRTPRRRYRTSLDDLLTQGSTYTSMHTLKRRLVEEGVLAPVCAACGIDSWMGDVIALHLDHVNGVRDDHRRENLRLLCPNCHSQTATFAGRNKGRYTRWPRPSS